MHDADTYNLRMTTTNEIGRLNITLPKRTIAALEAVVSERGKSSFIAQAIEEKLERERWERAFTTVQQLTPTLTHITNPVQWVEQLRQEDEQRLEGQDI
jgi:metal-responsive CopG/Arc/MetJ family transcriptional regulator